MAVCQMQKSNWFHKFRTLWGRKEARAEERMFADHHSSASLALEQPTFYVCISYRF